MAYFHKIWQESFKGSTSSLNPSLIHFLVPLLNGLITRVFDQKKSIFWSAEKCYLACEVAYDI